MRKSFAGLLSFGIFLACAQSSMAESTAHASAAGEGLSAAGALLTGDVPDLETPSLNRSEDAPKPPKPKKGKKKPTS
jgi:hypothetical protein